MTHPAHKRTSAVVSSQIEAATRLLVADAAPQKIVLFGSYAREDFDGDSDLDLLVILDRVDDRMGEMVRLRRVLRDIPMAIDVIVYSKAEVEQRKLLRGTMLYHALQEGRVLYDST